MCNSERNISYITFQCEYVCESSLFLPIFEYFDTVVGFGIAIGFGTAIGPVTVTGLVTATGSEIGLCIPGS